MNRKRAIDTAQRAIITLVIAVIGIIAMAYITGRAIDTGIDNKNTMLCKSAKVSGNREYLTRCNEYYTTGNIEYMRYMEGGEN